MDIIDRIVSLATQMKGLSTLRMLACEANKETGPALLFISDMLSSMGEQMDTLEAQAWEATRKDRETDGTEH